jgi:penicillin amidase
MQVQRESAMTLSPDFTLAGRLFLAVTLLSLTTDCGFERSSRNADSELADAVTIYRDSFGVPHVYGETDAAAAFGFAYAQAEDNFWQVEDNYIRAVGRASEVHGASALLDDWINRALRIESLSVAEYESANVRLRALLDAFAGGFNYYLQTHEEVRPRLLTDFEPWYALAMIRYLYFQRGFLEYAGLPRAAFEEAMHDSMGSHPSRSQAVLDPAVPRSERGSNSWAVTAAKSRSGHPMLLINPHLPFFGPSQVYEGHVISDEGWNFSGYTRFGFPMPYVGFNEDLGWASTDNNADLCDLYYLTFDNPENPLDYRYGENYRTAETWVEVIGVKTDSGVETLNAKMRKTHHGAVVAVQNGRPMAARMAKFETTGWLDQWYAMTRADSLDAFKAAVSRLDMLFGNYLYADREGNIFYTYNAAVPIRSEDFDWSAPVDGGDPKTEWQGYHTMDELPQVQNPSTSWIQNCNGTPYLSTSAGNPDPADYPRYMVTEGDNERSKNARRILASQDVFGFDEWTRLAYDTRAIRVESDAPEIVKEWQQLQRTDPERARAVKEAIALIRDWDGVSASSSEAMTLYVYWYERMRRLQHEEGLFEAWVNEPWPDVPLRKVQALEEAMAELKGIWGSWRVPWGEINRLQRVHSSGTGFSDDAASLGVAGAPSWAGAMFTFWSTPVEGQKRRYGIGGNSYVSVIEFGPVARARSLHVFGSSANPDSPHHFDQAARYTTGAFKPAWLTLEEVRSNAARSYQPGRE